MRWLKDIFQGHQERTVLPPFNYHSYFIKLLLHKGLEPISFNQVRRRLPQTANEDFLLTDKPDVLPDDININPYNVWIPRVVDSTTQIELTPCNLFGSAEANMYHHQEITTIDGDRPYFSLIVFPRYWNQAGQRVSLADVRNGADRSQYNETAFAISKSGTMIKHRRGIKKLSCSSRTQQS